MVIKKNNWGLVRNIGSVVLLLVLFVLAAFYIKKNISLFQDWRSLKVSYLLILLVLSLVYIVLQGLVLQAVLKPYEIILKFKEWFGLTVVTLMGNYLFPFGGLGIRAAYLKKRHHFDYTYFLSTLGAITVIEFLIMAIGGLITLAYWYFNQGIINWLLTILFIGVASVCLVILLFPLRLPPTKYKFVERIGRVINDWHELRKNKELTVELVRLIFWEFIVLALIYYVAFNAFNFNIHFVDAFLPASLSTYSLVIRILPASFGVYEGAVVTAAKFLGFTVPQGLLVTGLTRFSVIIWVFTLGPFFGFILMRNNNSEGVSKWSSGKS